MTRQFITTTLAVFAALCLFGGALWGLVAIQARTFEAEVSKIATSAKIEEADKRLEGIAELRRDIQARTRAAEIESAMSGTLIILRIVANYTIAYDDLPPIESWQDVVRDDDKANEKLIRQSTQYTEGEKKRILAKRYKVELTDPWGSDYRLMYRKQKGGTIMYMVCSDGPDKTVDTEDDLVARGEFVPED